MGKASEKLYVAGTNAYNPRDYVITVSFHPEFISNCKFIASYSSILLFDISVRYCSRMHNSYNSTRITELYLRQYNGNSTQYSPYDNLSHHTNISIKIIITDKPPRITRNAAGRGQWPRQMPLRSGRQLHRCVGG